MFPCGRMVIPLKTEPVEGSWIFRFHLRQIVKHGNPKLKRRIGTVSVGCGDQVAECGALFVIDLDGVCHKTCPLIVGIS